MNLAAVHNRVGIFHSVEVQEEINGEWLRDPKRSTRPLSEVVNDFLDEAEASAVFVSPPHIELVTASADKKVRTYRCSVSVIYKPREIIDDQASFKREEHKGQKGRRAHKQDEEIALSGVPEGYERYVLDAIDALDPATGHTKPFAKAFGPGGTINKFRNNKPGVAKAQADKSRKQPAVSAGPNKPRNRRDGRGKLRRLPGLGT